jgi:hypothetical protein
MFKALLADNDAYISNRIINAQPQLNANVGGAGSLDLYKLYGYTSTTIGTSSIQNVELTRLLIHFDLNPLRDLVTQGLIDPNNSTFTCKLHLFDVYGGQPTPNNFTVSVFPLSSSFTEGLGRDVVYYSDYDACNWLTSSYASGSWLASGCGFGGGLTGPCDYITSSQFATTQYFQTGIEDLNVDVTQVVSATLANIIPDSGFRISFNQTLESDTHSYFVKRFASRSAFNDELHPRLIVRFDDSIQDDTNNVYLDSQCTLFMYNYSRSSLTNLLSGTNVVSGSNCLSLTLTTPVSGSTQTLTFNASQFKLGSNYQTGIYSASIFVPSTYPLLQEQWQASGSITFTPIWKSLDGTMAYVTGSTFKAYPAQRGPATLATHKYSLSILGLRDEVYHHECTTLRVNIFDYTQPYLLNAIKLPVELPGITIRDVHYQVRDNDSCFVAIPFDTITNSTRLSNDSSSMFFNLDASNLTRGRSYVIDVLIVTNNNKQLYKSVSAPFRVV